MPEIKVTYQRLENYQELSAADQALVEAALAKLPKAHAPYSCFRVAAALRIGEAPPLVGTNQENASYPVGICAERVALSAASALYPDAPVETIVITYQDRGEAGFRPLAPCGMCRQAIHEQRRRQGRPIRLILATETKEVLVFDDADQLLPLSFSFDDSTRR